MIQKGLFAVGSGFFLLSPLVVMGQDRGMDLITEASRQYASVSTICADFNQHLMNPLLRQERSGAGRLCQARPNLFAMRFTDPEGDVIVADGESVWYYVPSTDDKQAFRGSIDQSTGGPDFHREFLYEPETKYDVTYEAIDEVAGLETHRLSLIPLERTSYRSAVLWLDQRGLVLRQVRVTEENGNERTITLRGVDFDVAIPGDWFSFTPPPGVLVISR